jgi:hypothetical protein
MPRDKDSQTTWRDLVTDWHLNQEVPVSCRCGDETSDDKLCAPSVTYADARLDLDTVAALDGTPDAWDHKTWIAAWGRNAPLIVSPNDFRLPVPPLGMSWLVTRILVGGVKVVEISLMRSGEDGPAVTVSHSRSVAEPEAVATRARRMVQQILS